MKKWNPQAETTQRISYINQKDSSRPLCDVKQGMSQIDCSFIPGTYDTIVVKNMFDNERIAGDKFTFVINDILNPLSTSAVEFTVTTFAGILFESQTSISYTGVIDRSQASFFATLPAQIDPQFSIIQADNSTVSEQTQLIIPFKVPVPIMLDLGCTILITLPDDFNIVPGKLTIYRGWGIFQGVSELAA